MGSEMCIRDRCDAVGSVACRATKSHDALSHDAALPQVPVWMRLYIILPEQLVLCCISNTEQRYYLVMIPVACDM